MNVPDRLAVGMYRAKLPGQHCTEPLKARNIELTTKETLSLTERHDVYIFHRIVHHSFIEHIQKLKADGGKIIFELDDDIFTIPKHNPAHKLTLETETLRYCLSLSDEVWVSTEHLKTVIEDEVPGKAIYVLPNLVDLDSWQHKIFNEGEIRMLWAGSKSHIADIQILKDLVEKTNYETYFMGDYVEALSKWVRIEHTNLAVMVPRKDLEHRLKYVDPVGLEAYPETLSALGCNVGLCPLVDEPFNYSKSNIKWLEKTLAGMCCVCANLPPYQAATFKVKEDWVKTVSLLEDEKTRNEIWNIDLDKVKKDYSWQSHRRNIWLDQFERCCK